MNLHIMIIEIDNVTAFILFLPQRVTLSQIGTTIFFYFSNIESIHRPKVNSIITD